MSYKDKRISDLLAENTEIARHASQHPKEFELLCYKLTSQAIPYHSYLTDPLLKNLAPDMSFEHFDLVRVAANACTDSYMIRYWDWNGLSEDAVPILFA